jgi:hypothetical protein
VPVPRLGFNHLDISKIISFKVFVGLAANTALWISLTESYR